MYSCTFPSLAPVGMATLSGQTGVLNLGETLRNAGVHFRVPLLTSQDKSSGANLQDVICHCKPHSTHGHFLTSGTRGAAEGEPQISFIIGEFGWEESLKILLFQPPAMGRDTSH